MEIILGDFLKEFSVDSDERIKRGLLYKITHSTSFSKILFYVKYDSIVPFSSVTEFEKNMREKFGIKVKITNKKIEIPYSSKLELQRILELMDVKIEG